MDISRIIFENEFYYVVIGEFTSPVRSNGCDFTHGYKCINKETQIVEFQVPQKPEAIAAAEQLSMALETKPWEWVRKQHTPAEVNPDGSPKESDETVH